MLPFLLIFPSLQRPSSCLLVLLACLAVFFFCFVSFSSFYFLKNTLFFVLRTRKVGMVSYFSLFIFTVPFLCSWRFFFSACAGVLALSWRGLPAHEEELRTLWKTGIPWMAECEKHIESKADEAAKKQRGSPRCGSAIFDKWCVTSLSPLR